ncbi:MAG: YlbF family regulator [Candidatus Saccharibacteria bacterium]|nr:YlbF family regulator [Candidatus Saccharibacteria bacterium]
MSKTKAVKTPKQAARELADIINETKEMKLYKKAMEELQADKKAQELIRQFQETRETVITLQRSGIDAGESMDKLNSLQGEIGKVTAIQDLTKHQANIQKMTQDLAIEISQKINFEFSVPQSGGGGCC